MVTAAFNDLQSLGGEKTATGLSENDELIVDPVFPEDDERPVEDLVTDELPIPFLSPVISREAVKSALSNLLELGELITAVGLPLENDESGGEVKLREEEKLFNGVPLGPFSPPVPLSRAILSVFDTGSSFGVDFTTARLPLVDNKFVEKSELPEEDELPVEEVVLYLEDGSMIEDEISVPLSNFVSPRIVATSAFNSAFLSGYELSMDVLLFVEDELIAEAEIFKVDELPVEVVSP